MAKKKDKDAGHDAPEGAEGAPEGGKKKPSMKLIIIGAVGAVLVLGGGGKGHGSNGQGGRGDHKGLHFKLRFSRDEAGELI